MTEQPPTGPAYPQHPAQQPPYPQQPYPQQPYPQPPYQQPPYQQPQYQQPPVFPSEDYGRPPAYGAPGPLQPEPAAQPTLPAAKKSKLPVVLAVVVAVVALVAAGTVFASSRGWFTASGSSTPNEAVEGVFQSLADGDILGVVDHLRPSEAKFSADMTGDFVDQLKRLDIIESSTTPEQLYSFDVTVSGLTFAPTPIPINDRVQVVEVTGGTIAFDGGKTTEVLTPKVRAALPDANAAPVDLDSFDIATQTAATGHALRIAAVSEDGAWYPSVAYTIADNAAYTTIGADYPSKLSPIAAVGAASPEAAMDNLVTALVAGDVEKLIATLDPGTMGALQDYASLGFNSGDDHCLWGPGGDAQSGACIQNQVSVSSAAWTTTEVTGGQKVSIGSLVLATPDGVASITRDPSVPSLTLSAPGEETIVISPDDVPDFFTALTDNFGIDLSGESAQVTDIVQRELAQVLNLGIIMVQRPGDEWYVSPGHTFSDVFVSLLRGLQPGDIDYFLSLSGN